MRLAISQALEQLWAVRECFAMVLAVATTGSLKRI